MTVGICGGCAIDSVYNTVIIWVMVEGDFYPCYANLIRVFNPIGVGVNPNGVTNGGKPCVGVNLGIVIVVVAKVT